MWFENRPNKAREYKTFMPKKAGKRNFRKFIMALSIPATAPGLVTRSLRLGTLNFVADFWRVDLSAAAASSSGVMDSVILEGSCSISFCRKSGRCL